MDDIALKPTNVTTVAKYLLSLQPTAIKESYQSNWQYGRKRLKEVLEIYANPGQIVGETIIDNFDRSLNSLFEGTRVLAEQLTSETKQQLQSYLQSR